MRLLAALFVALMPAAPAVAHDPLTFGDWFAVCDHDGYCSAWAQTPESLAEGLGLMDVFTVGRHREGIYWEMSFLIGAQLADPQILSVSVDDAAEALAAPDELGLYGNAYTYFLLGPKAQVVMDRLASGTTLVIDFVDAQGEQRNRTFPLDGLTDALIWIDEQQGRLGSERVAEAPPLGLDPVGGPTGQRSGEIALADLPADLVAMHEARPDACDPFDMLGGTPAAYELGEEGTLYFVPCSDGAYNYRYAAYLGTKWGYELLHFAAGTPELGWGSEDGVWMPSFDPATKTLKTYNLGRSAGDCGIQAEYVWEARRFVLTRVMAKLECDAAGEPGEFPVVYERTAGN